MFFSIIQRLIEFSISIANSIHATYFLCWNEGNEGKEGDKIEHFHLALKSGNAANHPFLLLTLWLLHQVAIVRLTRMSQNTFYLQNYLAASFIWVAGVSRGVSPLDCHGCLNQHLSTNSFQFNQKGANFLEYVDPCTLVDSISKRWFNPFCLIHCSALVQYCNVKDYPTVYKCDDPQWEFSSRRFCWIWWIWSFQIPWSWLDFIRICRTTSHLDLLLAEWLQTEISNFFRH